MAEPFTDLVNLYLAYLPTLIGALVVLLVGLILGAVMGRVASRIVEVSPIEKYVSEKWANVRVSYFSGLVVSWGIYLVFLKASTDIAGIPALSDFVGGIISFVFSIIGAVIILLVGFFIAGYVREEVAGMKIVHSGVVANVIFFIILYVAVALALPIAGIETSLVNNILLLIIGGVAVGLAIAIGLGLKDVIADVSREYIDEIAPKLKKK